MYINYKSMYNSKVPFQSFLNQNEIQIQTSPNI